MSINDKKYWVWLSLIPELGIKRKQRLLKLYETPEIIYNLKEKELLQIEGIGEHIVKNIINIEIRQSVEKYMNYMEKNNIDIISVQDKEYPSKLKKIYDSPISLYCKGNKNILDDKSIGIVGCREMTQYGEKASKYFSYNLAKKGINIVSGLARGIDGCSHMGAICAYNEINVLKENQICGKTIAVLGNGLDMVYPKEHNKLAKQILDAEGSIISEYPLGVKPDKKNFPARNRIISGISDGILVIEAKQKSGTLITADFALEQGKDVFVVPGNINSVNSVGTNELIKQGAQMVTNYKEIFL